MPDAGSKRKLKISKLNPKEEIGKVNYVLQS